LSWLEIWKQSIQINFQVDGCKVVTKPNNDCHLQCPENISDSKSQGDV